MYDLNADMDTLDNHNIPIINKVIPTLNNITFKENEENLEQLKLSTINAYENKIVIVLFRNIYFTDDKQHIDHINDISNLKHVLSLFSMTELLFNSGIQLNKDNLLYNIYNSYKESRLHLYDYYTTLLPSDKYVIISFIFNFINLKNVESKNFIDNFRLMTSVIDVINYFIKKTTCLNSPIYNDFIYNYFKYNSNLISALLSIKTDTLNAIIRVYSNFMESTLLSIKNDVNRNDVN